LLELRVRGGRCNLGVRGFGIIVLKQVLIA